MTLELEIGRKAAQILDEKLSSVSGVVARLGLIADEITGRIAFSTSLGIEDQALLHAISSVGERGKDIDVFTLDTGRHFPQTLETLERSELRYNRRIRVVVPDADELEALVARDGIFGFRASVNARRSCCDVRKVAPLRRALFGAGAWITGMRREQSKGRADVAFASWDDGHGLIKLNPIADWSGDQLATYVEDNAVPVNPLHGQGYPSIGCQPCTRAIEPGEDERAGRWWWENEAGKECGLHVGMAVPDGSSDQTTNEVNENKGTQA